MRRRGKKRFFLEFFSGGKLAGRFLQLFLEKYDRRVKKVSFSREIPREVISLFFCRVLQGKNSDFRAAGKKKRSLAWGFPLVVDFFSRFLGSRGFFLEKNALFGGSQVGEKTRLGGFSL